MIGIAYNCFSATELLPYSVQQVRPLADHILCLFDAYSFQGNPLEDENYIIAKRMLNQGIIDQIEIKSFGNMEGKQKEVLKRNFGKDILKEKGCTYFMTMDEDELYHTDELENAFIDFQKSICDASACQMQTYYKEPTICLDPPEEYFVPLFYKMTEKNFVLKQQFPVQADPSRKIETTRFLSFPREQIQMHHYSYVRKDIKKKFANAASAANWKHRIPSLIDWFEKYQYPDPAMLAGSKERFMAVKRVENYFNIEL